MITKSAGLLPGTLDLLILKAVSLDCLHGYGVLLRIQQILQRCLQLAAEFALFGAQPASSARGSFESKMGRERKPAPCQVLPVDPHRTAAAETKRSHAGKGLAVAMATALRAT